MIKIITLTVLAAILLSPLTVEARYFDPNDIFTDKELWDSSALSRTAIQQFLEMKNSVLKAVTATVAGVPKLVSEMIYELAVQYGISQKFLLAKLQHEQGLVEKETASQNALDWATGYSCYNRRCNEKYRGIYAQLDAAAATQKIYAERNYFNYAVGKETKTTDGVKVKPANQATANLYIYTPYHGGTVGIGGNYAFWRVWNRYFTERVFADGTLLKETETGDYWRIEKNKRRKFASPETYLKDYREQDALPIGSDRLAYYQTAAPIEFANNTVVKGERSGLLYLLGNNTKQRIAGESALALLGYRLADTSPLTPPLVPEEKLAVYAEGEPITELSVYPQGLLAQDGNGTIYLVKQGKRHPLLDEAVWQANFKKDPPVQIAGAELEKYPLGEPVKLRDGSVVKSGSGTFYIISVGKKYPVSQAEVIRRLYGEDIYANAPVASEAVLALHESGDRIDFINASISDPSPYVSYAERVGVSANQQASDSFKGVFEKVSVPTAFLMGESKKAQVSFRNTGASSWEAGKVQLEFFDEDSPASSLSEPNQIALTATVPPGGIAEFVFDLTASTTPGVIKEWFALEYQNESGVFTPMRGARVREEILVRTPVAGEIASHTLPKAVSARRGPIAVTVQIKNTSQKQIWTSRRTALILTAGNESASPFYDRYDWLDKQVVGVPVNKSKIKPGETGLIKFRLDPRKVKAGTHTLAFAMELRDVKQKVYLNNSAVWQTEIQVKP